MGDSISNLSPRVVINQSTAPTGSDNELKNLIWIDSSDGNTTKTYNTSTDSWESIGGKADGITIFKNQNGELQADIDRDLVIGDFEVDLDGFSFVEPGHPASNHGRDNTRGFRGSYSYYIRAYTFDVCDSGGSGFVEKDVDVSNADEVRARFYSPTCDKEYALEDVTNNNQVTSSSTGSWNTLSVDVSNVSGTITIRAGVPDIYGGGCGGSAEVEVYVDMVSLFGKTTLDDTETVVDQGVNE